MSRLTLAPRLVAATLLAGAASSLAVANVGASVWNGPSDFFHSRTGVPDMDQRRAGLPGGGNCHCVPTSYVNLLIYIANHGYPQVTPGVGDYTGYDHYAEVTGILDDLGEAAGLSPGGDDPNDPDCNDENGDGGDGECGSLPCGSKMSNIFPASQDFGYFGNAEDDLVFTAKWLTPGAPASSHSALAQMAFDGAVMQVSYGRYEIAGTIDGFPAWLRKGGHAVTMNAIFRDGNERTISVRDPAQDDGDIFGPSPWVTKVYDITEVSLLVTADDPADGPTDNWAWTVLPAIDEPQEDGKKRLIDSYFAIRPKTGYFWKDNQFIGDLPLSVGFGGYLPTHQQGCSPAGDLGCFEIQDLMSDVHIAEHGVGWFAIGKPSGSAPSQLLKIDPVAKTKTSLGATSATRLALNRLDDLYTLSESPPILERRDVTGAVKTTVSIAGLPAALACDDTKDTVLVVVPNSSGIGGSVRVYPRSLSVPTVLTFPTLLPIGTKLRVAVNPKDGHLWIASESNDTVREFKLPRTGGGTLVPLTTLSGFGNLTSVDFDDSGRMYLVETGGVKVFEKNATGAWVPGDAGAFNGIDVGNVVRVARSRSNFDPAIHSKPGWDNITPADLEPLGTSVPDCLGDLNGDGVVDGADLALVLGAWGNGAGLADIDENGIVDGADLAIVLGSWGDC
ncbi:MAG: hypothetical protein JNM94_01785 [Phycisphaerae bacterium]|nr:hypothetical protein [Phycisphaerae bacterium]